jgi:hypothetical protein
MSNEKIMKKKWLSRRKCVVDHTCQLCSSAVVAIHDLVVQLKDKKHLRCFVDLQAAKQEALAKSCAALGLYH